MIQEYLILDRTHIPFQNIIRLARTRLINDHIIAKFQFLLREDS
jgi:hypothetical protein